METSTSTNWKEEIEQILKEASAIIDEVERSMQDNNDKHDSKTRDNIIELIEQLRTNLTSDNIELIKQSTLKLRQFL